MIHIVKTVKCKNCKKESEPNRYFKGNKSFEQCRFCGFENHVATMTTTEPVIALL